GGDPGRCLARARAPAAAPVTDAVLRLVGVVRVARAELLADLLVVARALVLVGDDERDRGAERAPLEDPGDDAHGVGLLARGDEAALAGGAAVELGLDVGLGERQQRRAAVHHRPDAPSVRLPPGRHAEELSEGVAHAASAGILPATPPGRQRLEGRV